MRTPQTRIRMCVVAFLSIALMLCLGVAAYMLSDAKSAAAGTTSSTQAGAAEAADLGQASSSDYADSDSLSSEAAWSASLRSSVEEAARELNFKTYSLGDSFRGYPLTEVRVLHGSLFLFYRFDPRSPEAEATGYEGFLVREFSSATNAGLIAELESEYPIVDSVLQGSSEYNIRRGAGEHRTLILTERDGTTIFLGMFVKPVPSLLADAAAALEEVAQ